ncbi:lipocalin family protein [Persicirhabdus sediminis]|uniref:Outer membrane lipoprotein Blc n=1 Tax=Persicirhabdus sediminis TaxID=454144 RepID=A0A8J7MH33_9BACT|nr:lipocalin family protein [Persicirhabdus sediminis]MBK1792812.1 lipocalin family protein [Persicirhabdus sediminis]
MQKITRKLTLLLASAISLTALSQCTTKSPADIQPVSQFQLDRYLGTWYEIARLDHSFERGLENISANYSQNPDGTVKVINRGFKTATQQWQEAEGKAKFVADPTTGHLKVSFFGPFYGSYIIFELDHKGYQYALISGPNKNYFWLLARTPELDAKLQSELINLAKAKGFATDQLIFP